MQVSSQILNSVPIKSDAELWTISPSMEWEKWLSYIPDFEKKQIEEIENKMVVETTLAELQTICDYRKQQYFARLFRQFCANTIGVKDRELIHSYIDNESIVSLMMKKLTEAEMVYAQAEIKRLKELPDDVLMHKVQVEKVFENYTKMGMVDAYILHRLLDIVSARTIIKERGKMKQYNHQKGFN